MNQSEKDKKDDKKSCCGCSCDAGRIAEFFRHLAAFFDKKQK